MRDIQRGLRPNLRLARGADGRLKKADESDIGDIWAEQKRIKLADAILEDKRRADKKQRRQAKEFVVTLDVSKVKLPSLKPLLKFLTKRFWFSAGAVVLLLMVVGLGFNLLHHAKSGPNKDAAVTATSVLGSKVETPDYHTLLPKGKSIQDLGGWGRVSPPDKNPVYAYADDIKGVHITVSQQPLPDSFKADVAGSVSKLATSYAATNKLEAGGTTLYVGTSVKGPQSAIAVKDDVLLLIKSTSAISDQGWADYVAALQ